MSPAAPRGLVPPRPNLGPEPWWEPPPILGTLAVLGLLVLLLLAGLLGRRHRRTIRARRGATAPGGGPDSQTSPRDRLVALSESVREALTLQFGASCRAKTTEELATDDRIGRLLGESDFQELIRFLDQVDRVKFAPERSDGHQEALQEALTIWAPRVASLRARIRAKPRRRSKTNRGVPPVR